VKTCGGEGKRGDETKVRRERRRRVCTRRGQKRDRWGERMGERGRKKGRPLAWPTGLAPECWGIYLDEFFIN
jgi:hypothetical protein